MAFLNVVQARSKNFDKILSRKFMQAMLSSDKYGRALSYAARIKLQERLPELSQETVDLVAAMDNPDLTAVFWDRLSEPQRINLLRNPEVSYKLTNSWPDAVIRERYKLIMSSCPHLAEGGRWYIYSLQNIAKAVGAEQFIKEYGDREDVKYWMKEYGYPRR
jgi:hypothetical protein